MKKLLKKILPARGFALVKTIYHGLMKIRLLYLGRPSKPAETTKAKLRRQKEGFFENYCSGRGLDIGYGGDPVVEGCKGWDWEHGDAQYLKEISDETFDFVYSSHTIEHMVDPLVAVQNWWRVLRLGGYLILYLPHRDLYEKKKNLPSRWNPDHKNFFLLEKDEAPNTIGILPLIKRLPSNEVVYAKVCAEGHTVTDPEKHSDGEYSIELVVKKQEQA